MSNLLDEDRVTNLINAANNTRTLGDLKEPNIAAQGDGLRTRLGVAQEIARNVLINDAKMANTIANARALLALAQYTLKGGDNGAAWRLRRGLEKTFRGRDLTQEINEGTDEGEAVVAGQIIESQDEWLSDLSSSQPEASEPVKDFMRWSSYRTRWGESYTHLFDVMIWDSPGYSTDEEKPLDFTETSNAFRFACIGATVGGHNLEFTRVGGLDLPLPTGGQIPDLIQLEFLDYTRQSIYNYMYAWYLNFYNPHKRRLVGGRAGKYKNIRINVYSLYGQYHDPSGRTAKPDSSQDSVTSNRASEINDRYDIISTISAFNCIPKGFPGTSYQYTNGSEPFKFTMDIMPSDVYYDFRNKQSYTHDRNRPHLEALYKAQLAEGTAMPGEEPS